ncbi:MAG: TatD family hydrolase [Candidatus Thorarchaeota archaeon]
MEFFDTHSHLEMPRLYPKAESIVRRAKDAGVIGVVVSAIEPKFFPKALDLKKRFPGFIWPTFGLHPPRTTPQMLKRVIKAIRDHAEEIVAIGEVGLDYYWVKEQKPREFQKEALCEFIHLAEELKLPLVVHSRESEADALNILKEQRVTRVQLHCFNEPNLVREAANQKWLMSVPTSVVSRRRMQRVATAIPLANMLLETDAPYLSPFPGQTNEPANLPHAAEKLAKIKGTTAAAIAQTTTGNALSFLGLNHAKNGLEKTDRV